MSEKSVAEQSRSELGGAWSILVRQRRDHAALQAMMQRYEAAVDDDVRTSAVTELTDRALRHAFAEETVLFPATRHLLPSAGDALTRHIEGEHQEINELLHELRGMRPDYPRYDAAARRAIELIRDDARKEEDVLLPELQRALTVGQLRGIGVTWEAARLAAPNLPHPRVPRRPWGNVMAGIPLALTDRVERAGRGVWDVASSAVAAARSYLRGNRNTQA